MIIDTNFHKTSRIFNVAKLLATTDDIGRVCYQIVRVGDGPLTPKETIYPEQISSITSQGGLPRDYTVDAIVENLKKLNSEET